MQVVDGDTIKVSIAGKTYTVRCIGIDTPETRDPRRGVQCYGKEASAKNRELVGGKMVELEKDVSETDKYGRLLRYVYVGDLLVNAEREAGLRLLGHLSARRQVPKAFAEAGTRSEGGKAGPVEYCQLSCYPDDALANLTIAHYAIGTSLLRVSTSSSH